MKKEDEEFLKETELRKAKNYDARMDAWNGIRGKDPKLNADANKFAYGCVFVILIIALLSAIFG